MVPTIYTLDSGEFVTGAFQLGFVHAPGYPLYLLLLHLFQRLPATDIGYLGNLFSALCLVLAVVCTYHMLHLLIQDRWLAWLTALLFGWGYYVWLIGLFTEVYAPQLVTLALTGWSSVVLLKRPKASWRIAVFTGGTYGLAVAMNPTSIFLAGGVVTVFCCAHLRWSQRITAGLFSILIFSAFQLYFPLRYAAQPTYSLAGHYLSDGKFMSVDLGTVQGILWVLTGRQFGSLFFADGVIPPASAILNTVMLFVQNTLGFGLLIGLIGLWVLYRYSRQGFAIWCSAFLPYLYFYTTYGAGDKFTMFGPVFWLWSVPIGFGLHWLVTFSKARLLRYGLVALPILLLVVNFPRLDLSSDYSVRQRTEALMKALPTNAMVFGQWGDIVPVEYLHIVEGMRHDIKTYNQFLFSPTDLRAYLDSLLADGKPTVLIASMINGVQLPSEAWDLLVAHYQIEVEAVPLATGEVPLYIYHLRRPLSAE